MSKTISPPATIRIPQNCVIVHGDLVAIKPDYVIGAVNKMNPEFMDISVPMTIIEDKITNDDIGKYEAVTAFTGKKPISPKALELMKKVNAENAKATEVHNSKRSEI